MLKKIIKYLKINYYKSSSGKYIQYLKSRGMQCGENVDILSCQKLHIDEDRAKFIKIGSNVVICTGVTILAHDYSWCVLREAYNCILPSGGGKVIIGDNVFIGENATILRNVVIGNNCIIGAGAVVSKDIPDNSVCAGVPAKVIMSLDDYKVKREATMIDEIRRNIEDFKLLQGRYPNEAEMGNFRILFMPRTEENLKWLMNKKPLGGSAEKQYKIFVNTEPMFESYEAMLKHLGYYD